VASAAVAVEALVHLVDQLVARVHQRAHRVAVTARYPRPRSCPRVAFGRYVLRRGARRADAVDGGLVQLHHQRLVHVVVLVGVEDDERVIGEFGGDGRPLLLEADCVGDDVVVAVVVIRLDHGVGALGLI